MINRITQNSVTSTYQYNLDNIRSRYTKLEIDISSGSTIRSPSDDPYGLAEVNRLSTTIKKNKIYSKNIDDGLTDTQVMESTLEKFTDILSNVKDIAIDASKPTNYDKQPVFASQIRGLINDLIEVANYEFDGRFAFAGTKTTRTSISTTPPQKNSLPYELVQDTSFQSASNPEGLKMFYKGNNEDRTIITSSNTVERVNTRASDAFGPGGTDVFEKIIGLYNVMKYNSDGTERADTDFLKPDEVQKLTQGVQDIGNAVDTLTSEKGRLGGVSNRLQALKEQFTYENLRVDELRSIREDTDLPEAILKLKKEENGLAAALGIGQKVVQQSLLDFLK